MTDPNKINITTEQIYQKDFSFERKGYNKREVDEFLDQITQDELYYLEIIQDLTQQLETTEQQSKPVPSDVIARIENLERKLNITYDQPSEKNS